MAKRLAGLLVLAAALSAPSARGFIGCGDGDGSENKKTPNQESLIRVIQQHHIDLSNNRKTDQELWEEKKDTEIKKIIQERYRNGYHPALW
jgi:hypothetical protein